MLFHDARHAPSSDSFAAIIEKHRGFAFTRKIPFFAQLHTVVAQGLKRSFADRHDALLGAFAEHAHDAQLKISIGAVETHQLAHAHSRGVKKLQNRAVANIQRALDRNPIEQVKRIVHRQKRRQRLFLLRRANEQKRVFFDLPRRYEIATETLERRELPAD